MRARAQAGQPAGPIKGREGGGENRRKEGFVGSAGFSVFRTNVSEVITTTSHLSLFKEEKQKAEDMGPNSNPSQGVWDTLDKPLFLQETCFSSVSGVGRGGVRCTWGTQAVGQQ